MESRLLGNEITVPIGTAIGFKMIGKNKEIIDIKLSDSEGTEEKSKYLAIFDENDVDFQIEINNTKSIHGIGYTLIVNNGFYDYYIGPHEHWTMEALVSRGRKLHFISRNSDVGQTVVSETAQEFDISYTEASAVCSRIEFNLEAEKLAKTPVRMIGMRKKGGSMNVVQGNSSQSLGQDVPDSLSSNISSILERDAKLDTLSCLDDRAQIKPQMKAQIQTFDSGSFVHSLAKPFKKSKSPKTEAEVGDKGVVCFGDESNQLYNPYQGFSKDPELLIKPFVVELRFSKQTKLD